MQKETLTEKEKALAYVGASIVSGCKPCTIFHIEKCKTLGSSDQEIKNIIIQSIEVSKLALDTMESYGFNRLKVNKSKNDTARNFTSDPGKINIIVSITSAYTMGNTQVFRNYSKHGKKLGLTDDDLLTLADISWMIKEKAQSQLDKYCENGDREIMSSCCPESTKNQLKTMKTKGCGC